MGADLRRDGSRLYTHSLLYNSGGYTSYCIAVARSQCDDWRVDRRCSPSKQLGTAWFGAGISQRNIFARSFPRHKALRCLVTSLVFRLETLLDPFLGQGG